MRGGRVGLFLGGWRGVLAWRGSGGVDMYVRGGQRKDGNSGNGRGRRGRTVKRLEIVETGS